ncbi:hypothetical protein SpCBS45565_g05370 [Spizellomyces sp. 'palustris']|nr:hypothetical protein SpCBS45565_g05370 [Spizellomyces sp. 'palustris']
MGKQRPRYNERARASSHLAKTAKPHPHARDGGLKKKRKSATEPAPISEASSVTLITETSTGASTSEDNVEYSASKTDVPLVLVPGEKGPSGEEDKKRLDLSLLEEEPTGKLTSKKRKRLEKFIEKQLKKEERVKLLQKLSEQSFSSELLRSSKALGQHKLTAREKLRQALLEERAGISRSDLAVRLLVEKDLGDGVDAALDGVGAEVADSKKETLTAVNDNASHDQKGAIDVPLARDQPEPLGIVSRAFGKVPPTPASVEVFEEYGGATKKDEDNPSAGFGAALKSSQSTAIPSFGAALKRKAPDDGVEGAQPELTIPKRKKKKQKKKAAPVIEEPHDSDSEAEDANHTEEEGAGGAKKDIWAADVVVGEHLNSAKLNGSTQKQPISATTSNAPKTTSNRQAEPNTSSKPIFHVPVNRPESVQLTRISLPVVMEEQPIMEAILNHDVTILCGETGSGKTTQVPQFLYEAGFGDPSHPQFPGLVGVTQPRRVAAVSMARRVSDEMALKNGEVAYQIRYDKGSTGRNTRIKFMTDGILLRELSVAAGGETQQKRKAADGPADLLLSKYSCIIIDEAHERTVGTDVLIGWLTRIAALRNSGKVAGVKPLKLVIMSATLRVEDFTMNQTLFATHDKPPVVKVDGRQHKVVIHYNKRTPEVDYVTEAFKKVSKIHNQLPPGGILVFLTGQQEIQILVRKLRKAFSLHKPREAERNRLEETFAENGTKGNANMFDEADGDVDMETGPDDYNEGESDVENMDEDEEEEEVEVLGGLSDDENEPEPLITPRKFGEEAAPLHVLPLYSLLPTAAQMRVFEAPPAGSRLVVIATNVAETSLTIPGIKYVVDCGKVKERRYDANSGVQTYQICWTSRASADQRAGRAGRVGPGHCYRLFSSAVFNDYFEQFSQPEILRVPIEGVVLQMKSMGINNVVGFPFPTPPGKENLRAAEKLLLHLGAVDTDSNTLKITELGKLMAKFPVSPRFAKMIIVAASQTENILPYVIAIVSGLSVGDPFIRDEDIVGKGQEESDEDDDNAEEEKERRSKKRVAFWKTMATFSGTPPTSDALRLLTAIGAHTAEYSRSSSLAEKFCEKHFLRPKAMDEMRKLRGQLTNLVKMALADNGRYPSVRDLCVDPRLPPPNPRQAAAIRQVLLSGFADRVARLDDEASKGWAGKKYVPVYRTMWGGKNEVCQIHPSSCLHRERPAPRYVIYDELIGKEEKISADNTGVISMRANANVTAPDGTSIKKHWLKGVSSIEDTWISLVAPRHLCRMGKVMEQPEPRYDGAVDKIVGYCIPNFGPRMWDLPPREMELPRLEDRCKWFARSLIEGKVVLMEQKGKSKRKGKRMNGGQETKEVLAKLAPFVTTKTVTITKSWGKSQTKVGNLVDTMVTDGIDSKAKLISQWRQNRTFLLTQYLAFIPDDFHACLSQNWPPAVLYNRDVDDAASDAIRIGELLRGVEEICAVAKGRREERDFGRAESESEGDSDF